MKPKEMVTGREAFDNFKRLMRALLAVPKDKVVKAERAPQGKRKKGKPDN